MSETMQKVLDEIQKLDPNRQEILAGYLLHIIETEEYLDDDDDSDVADILSNFLDEDGSVNFEKVNQSAIVVSLEDLYREEN